MHYDFFQVFRSAMVIEPRCQVYFLAATAAIPRANIPIRIVQRMRHSTHIIFVRMPLQPMGQNSNPVVGVLQIIQIEKVTVSRCDPMPLVC